MMPWLPHLNDLDEPCDCRGQGVIDGAEEEGYTSCYFGEAAWRREERRHRWMIPYVERARWYEREGDHEAAEAIRRAVVS